MQAEVSDWSKGTILLHSFVSSFPLTADGSFNFLEVHWLESESRDGAVQISESFPLQHIKLLPPFDAEDVFDCTPTTVFNSSFF